MWRPSDHLRPSRSALAALGLAVLAVGLSLHKYWLGSYNNYLIFSRSFDVLRAGGDLYTHHPELHDDLFKYSPTFALAMAPFAWQPDLTGLVCWNVLNALALFAAVKLLWPDEVRPLVATGLLTIELVTSLQSSQSNGLVAALVILTFVSLERRRAWAAAGWIAAGFFLKIYGAAAAILALVHPDRWRVAARTVLWCVALGAAPLVALSFSELAGQYAAWLRVGDTFDPGNKASLMRVIDRYLVPGVNARLVQGIGAAILLLPLVRRRACGNPLFRLRLLCSLLIAMVIFNDSAEPPTYIVAVAGAAIWYVGTRPRPAAAQAGILALLFAVSLVSTDAYPRAWRAVAGPYTVKALGSLALWLWINAELLFAAHATENQRTSSPA
jgi:hypothetical protein